MPDCKHRMEASQCPFCNPEPEPDYTSFGTGSEALRRKEAAAEGHTSCDRGESSSEQHTTTAPGSSLLNWP